MSTILDLPDEPKFTIKTVASQTGIQPVTLRAWERRHGVLTPHRADNRYRLYSERDVEILRWLKSRVDNGITISSAVSELRGMSINNIWPEALPTAPKQTQNNSLMHPNQYAVQLYQALIKHDEVRAGNILREIHAIFNLMTVILSVLIPTLREIGEAWYRGEIRVTTEHFASAYLRGKLLTLLQAYSARRNAPLILIGCAPMEQHELGSLMLAVLLRSEGYRVEYLGPDIPIEDLADYASYERPSMVVLSASSEYSAREMRRMEDLLRKSRNKPLLGYGGRAFDLHPELRNQIPGNYLGETLDTALATINNLLNEPNRA